MIDLRSDTVTQPSPAMRAAMAEAAVGDDVYGDDPTVIELEKQTAEILGKEEAVFMPTGSMSNQVALRAHTESGDEILTDVGAHLYVNEGGAPAGLNGLNIRPLMGDHGVFTADDVHRAARMSHPFSPRTIPAPTKLLCLENTHNSGGGTVWPLETMKEAAAAGRSQGFALHLDGARLWNASVASGVSEKDLAAPFDTVSVCFSKGLGAPVGSALAGSSALMLRARRFKQMFGGGLRQAGLLAAGALFALENHRDDLAADHAKAQVLAAGLASTPGAEIDPSRVHTNIVRFRLTSVPSGTFVERCYEAGLYMLPSGPKSVRAVVHRDVSQTEVTQALDIVRAALSEQAA